MIKHTVTEDQDGFVIITLQNGKSITLGCSLKRYESAMTLYKNGHALQNAFYFLSPSEREFLLTGLTDDEWDDIFAEDAFNEKEIDEVLEQWF